jgi:uncharacterized protein YdiU (UPF0061 family)
MELSELVAKLLELFNADKTKVMTAIQVGAHGLYQTIFDKGHGEGLKKGRDEKKESDENVTKLTADLEKATNDLKTLREKTPDVETVRKQYQTEIDTLKETHKNEIKAEKERTKGIERKRVKAQLQAKLEKKVKPAFAKVTVQDEDVDKRLRIKDDLSLEVLQAGKDIPFSPADGQDALDLLVDELVSKADAEWKLAEGDQGSGVRGGTTGGAGANLFDNIRKDRETGDDPSRLNRRLGVNDARSSQCCGDGGRGLG